MPVTLFVLRGCFEYPTPCPSNIKRPLEFLKFRNRSYSSPIMQRVFLKWLSNNNLRGYLV